MTPIHLCIGAPRSGTTWLFRELSSHPDIFVPAVKEVRFWNHRRSDSERDGAIAHCKSKPDKATWSGDVEWLAKWGGIHRDHPPCMEDYHRLMAGDGRPSIDISPAYMLLPEEKVRRLREGLPKGSRVVFMIRDPLDRLLSQAKLHFQLHGMYRGQPSPADLDTFLQEPAQRRRWDYMPVIRRWSTIFRDDFRVFYYDEMVADPAAFCLQMRSYLNLEPQPAVQLSPDPVHASRNQNRPARIGSFDTLAHRQMAQALTPAAEAFADATPDPGVSWLSRLREQSKQSPRPAPNAESLRLNVERLMRMTESLGHNCEYGFWQRDRVYEPSSLFRWALTPAKSLISYLESPGPVFEASNLTAFDLHMVLDRATGMRFHSKLVERDGAGGLHLRTGASFDEIHQLEYAKFDHLRKKFLAQMELQDAVYISKPAGGIGEGKMRQMLAALRRRNRNHHLLWIIEQETADSEILEDLGGGLLRGRLARFAKAETSHKYHPTAWSTLMSALADHPEISGQIARMRR